MTSFHWSAHSPQRPERPAANWRSVLVGAVGVIFVCALTPYNDYVANNTHLIGNFLPIGAMLYLMAFIFGVNAPLWRWAPRHALKSGELAIAFGMVLVSCAIPASGLMGHL